MPTAIQTYSSVNAYAPPGKKTIPKEANCNCERTTNRGEAAESETAGR